MEMILASFKKIKMENYLLQELWKPGCRRTINRIFKVLVKRSQDILGRKPDKG